ncbi:hypothetical protein [Sulfuriroseicoccus oceanibius]|uniref:Uncharacterized protein n=1 Tax=Sulfuriroseicoccus oceanibius TaxID=2707525 RepID=A0A6B3L0R2_9BACT|nr:hypothetical protein [Sulfuriroseicoccus oceanibius]QQL44325.1 hypothetical protein G3M56_010570 [Sulfuriroseicoccus oceanibius]
MQFVPSIRSLIAIAALAFATAPLVPQNAHAGDKKAGVRISFHVEGDETDGPNRVRPFRVHGEEKFFTNIPVVTHEHFVAYYPFANENGTFGAAFLLNERGQTRIKRAALEHKEGLMIPVINASAGEPIVLDGATSPFIVVWNGLSTEHFAFFEKEWKLRPISGPEDLPPGIAN